MSSQKTNKTLQIEGMSCQKCVKRVEKILAADKTIESIEVDLASGKASFICQTETDIPALIQELKEYDFNVLE